MNWRPPAPSSGSSLASLFRSSARAFLSNSSVHSRRDFSSLSLLLNGEELSHLVTFLRVFSLKVLSELLSQTRLSPERAPTLLPFCLGDVVFISARFSPAVSLSPKVLKLHACDLGPHPGFVLASCFDEQTHDFVSQGDCFLSSRVRARLPSGPFRVTWDALTYWKRTADDNPGEAAGELRCDGGGFVVQARRMAAYLGDLLLRTGLPALPSTLLLVLTCSAALLALSLSLSSFHAACPQALHARYPPWARASSCMTCTHASVPMVRTSAPRTTVAWMKTTSPVGTLPKPKPLSTNHLSTTSLTTLVLSARAFLEAGFALFVFQLGVFPLQPFQPPDRHIRLHVDLPFTAHKELDHSADLRAGLGPSQRFAPPLPWPGGVSHRPPCLAPPGSKPRPSPLSAACLSRVSSTSSLLFPPWTRPCVSQETSHEEVDARRTIIF